MRTVCFDTSTINNLMIDSDVERLTTTLLERYDVYITALNIVEIGKTALPEKRERLRAFEKRLTKTYMPLDMPNEIVKKITAAFGRGETEANFGVTDDRRGLWVAMSEPNSVGKKECTELKSWEDGLEESNRESTARLRARFDQIFACDPTSRPTNAARSSLLFEGAVAFALLAAISSVQGGDGAGVAAQPARRSSSGRALRLAPLLRRICFPDLLGLVLAK
jgi:hypothetical protein